MIAKLLNEGNKGQHLELIRFTSGTSIKEDGQKIHTLDQD